MRPEAQRLILDLDGLTPGRKDFVSWTVGLIRTGDNLADRERADLIRWLVTNGYRTDRIGDVYTIQYTNDECAAALGCDKRQAIRYRNWLVSSGGLITVEQGRKNYAGLFIQAPVMVTNTADIVPLNKVTIQPALGDNLAKIGGHSNHTNCENMFLSRVIQSNPKKSSEKWVCPRCGNGEFDLSPNSKLFICKSCNTATPMRTERQ